MPRNYPKERKACTFLTEKAKEEIRKIGYNRAGVTYPMLATRYGVTTTTVGSFLRKVKANALQKEDQELSLQHASLETRSSPLS